MGKSTITSEQKRAIDEKMVTYEFDKASVVAHHAKPGAYVFGYECLNDLDLDTLCRYLYAPDTVEIEMSVDERLQWAFNTCTTIAGNHFSEIPLSSAFRLGMQQALKIIGRQTPGVIVWEDDK